MTLSAGRIIVRGKLITRGKPRRADYVLYYKPGLPLAVVEAKDNNHSMRDGIQQALDYAAMLDVPFAFSSNGDGFVFHDRTRTDGAIETEIALSEFPSPEVLWQRYLAWKGIGADIAPVYAQDYHNTGKQPRYYQTTAVNRAIEAIAKGQDRVLLVMATGTGKTYTAFQIIWRLWKAGRAKRVLYLADRNVLIDQTMVNDFRPFGGTMAKLSTRSKTIERDDGTSIDLTTALDNRRRIVVAAALAAVLAPTGAFAQERTNPILRNDAGHFQAPEPLAARTPAPIVVDVDGGFDWAAAAVGAAGGLGLALVGLGGASAIRRRQLGEEAGA